MGRKFIVEEVEEKSEFGCGSIVAMIIIALVIGLCGGFKSCKEDKKPSAVQIKTEQAKPTPVKEAELPPYTPNNSYSGTRQAIPTATSEPQKKATGRQASTTVVPIPTSKEEIEPRIPASDEPQDEVNATSDETEMPTLTEKERRKAERQAKRDARRREKAQKNN